MLFENETDTIIAAYYAVYRELGFGFLEGSYSNSMAVELASRGCRVVREFPIKVVYRGVEVGAYRLDLVVNEHIAIEVKAGKSLTDADKRQLLNYLKATRIEVGLLLLFGPQPKVQRVILSNDRKSR